MATAIGNYKKWKTWWMKYVCCLCDDSRNRRLTNLEVIEELESAFKELEEQTDSKSLLSRHLDRGIFQVLKERMTPEGNTLLEVIISGTKHPESRIGVYCPDPEGYATFPELFYPILCSYNKLKTIYLHPSIPDFGPPGAFYILDEHGERVKSIRFEISRNLKDWTFTPTMSKTDFINLQNYMLVNFKALKGAYKGTYARAKNIQAYDIKVLNDKRLLIPIEDKLFEDASGRRFWPFGRGVFLASTMDFAVWVNFEDHLKIIVAHSSGNFSRAYDRMIRIHEKMHMRYEYHSSHLGYTTVCPTNLGTGLKCELEVEFPLLKDYPEIIKKICKKNFVCMHGPEGEFSKPDLGGTFFIRSVRTLGFDEFECVQPLYEAVLELLVIDHKLMVEKRKSDFLLYLERSSIQS